jgi:hypothetical protein
VRRDRRLEVATIACFVLGVGLLVPFEVPVTLTLGVLFLLAFIVCGAILLAGPGSGVLDDDDAGERVDPGPTA